MNQRSLILAVALCLLAVSQSAYGQAGVFVPPGSNGFFRQVPQQNTGQNGSAQILQNLQFQQQQFLNQQALQQSGIGTQNGAVLTTGHPTFFNDYGRYFNSGLNSAGGAGTGVSGTAATPFFQNNATATNPFTGSGLNVFLGIGR